MVLWESKHGLIARGRRVDVKTVNDLLLYCICMPMRASVVTAQTEDRVRPRELVSEDNGEVLEVQKRLPNSDHELMAGLGSFYVEVLAFVLAPRSHSFQGIQPLWQALLFLEQACDFFVRYASVHPLFISFALSERSVFAIRYSRAKLDRPAVRQHRKAKG